MWISVRSLLVIFLIFPGSLALARESPLTEVSFIPQWVPQAQFAGYYVAYEKGFYRDHHLAVKILKGGPERPPSELLKKGQADFGTMFLTTGIEKRAHGLKLVNIAQMVQRSALMLVAKKASGIKNPKDINGKKVGLWGEEFQMQPRAFFRKFHLSVKVVPQSATLNLFLRGGVDVASAMWYNEYHLILNAGVDPEELVTFRLSDYGMNFPEDGIYCREDTFLNNPQLCRNFVRASLAGWQYAFAHREEALDIVMTYVTAAKVATDRGHQKWMLERMRDIILPPGSTIPMGILKEKEYYQVAGELKKNGLIDNIPNFSQFYRDCAGSDEK